MSANNQTLIKEHKGKWYVFENVMAESWDDVNHLYIGDEKPESFDSRDEAYERALELDQRDGTEYGVQFNRLCKDDAEVIIIENKEKETVKLTLEVPFTFVELRVWAKSLNLSRSKHNIEMSKEQYDHYMDTMLGIDRHKVVNPSYSGIEITAKK